MPTYQYVCTQCDTPLEAVQSFSDSALTDCPVCRGRLRKVFSAVGVVFKGSGFYKNDSRPVAKSDSGSSEATAGGDTKTESAPAAKTDAAPAAKSEAKPAPAAKTKPAATKAPSSTS